MVTERNVVSLLSELVAIPSVNPSFDGGTGEGALAQFVAGMLEDLGASVELQEVQPGRSNVVGTLPGKDGQRRLLFEAHLDTVQTTGMTVDPFGAEVREGRLYGRGACDTKASLAAMLLAMDALSNDRPSSDVVLGAVIDEEVTFSGAKALVSAGLRADGGIVGEPTDLRLVVAHKGLARFYVEMKGRAAHSATPKDGVNAIEGMADVIAFLRSEGARFARRSHPMTGSMTLCVTQIRGGSGTNTVPELCTLHVDCRPIPGDRPDSVWRELRASLEKLNTSIVSGMIVVHSPYLTDDPMETPVDKHVIRTLSQAVAEAGGSTEPIGRPYATDASKFTSAGIPCVVFGPGSLSDAHTAEESVSLAEVTKAVEILVRTARLF